MIKHNKKLIVILCIIINIIAVVSLSFIISCFLNNNDIEIIKDIQDLKDTEIAMFINDGDGYIPHYSTEFPKDRELNLNLSGCFDNNDNRLTNALSYKDGVIEVNTSKSCYCYLYFEEEKLYTKALGKYLLEHPTNGLNTKLEAGLYRYQGEEVDNYVCFGTYDKSTCTSNPDIYMYRIIGINNKGQVKLIKYTGLDNYYVWYTSYQYDVPWPESIVFSKINGEGFLKNTKYISDGWENKIENINWKHGSSTSHGGFTGNKMYEIENGFTDLVNAKVGLSYIHDLYYAAFSGGNVGNMSILYNTWLTKRNDIALMTKYGYRTDDLISGYHWWGYFNGGNSFVLGTQRLSHTFGTSGIKPTFYLKDSVEYSSGNGTSDDPYIIK